MGLHMLRHRNILKHLALLGCARLQSIAQQHIGVKGIIARLARFIRA